jgi:F-type H+-transporting ATPase subunit delta
MRKDVISKKYARSIYDSYKGQIKDVLDTLSKVIVASDNEDYKTIIKNPFFSATQKSDFILAILDTKDNKIINFIKVVAQKNKLILLPLMINYLELFYVNDNGKYEGYIYASKAITKKDVDNLSKLVSKKISKDVSLLYKEGSDFNGVKISIEQLDLELVFSKDYIKSQLSNHILKAI